MDKVMMEEWKRIALWLVAVKKGRSEKDYLSIPSPIMLLILKDERAILQEERAMKEAVRIAQWKRNGFDVDSFLL
jgi:hypothetical protein